MTNKQMKPSTSSTLFNVLHVVGDHKGMKATMPCIYIIIYMVWFPPCDSILEGSRRACIFFLNSNLNIQILDPKSWGSTFINITKLKIKVNPVIYFILIVIGLFKIYYLIK